MFMKKKQKKIITELEKNLITLITAAFAFVAALRWNDAITAWLEPLTLEGEGVVPLTFTAIIVTLIAVVITFVLTKIMEKKKKRK